MENRSLQLLVRHIRDLAGEPLQGEQTDRALLSRFVGDRDEAAFVALLKRHGPMVRAVCARLLRQPSEVDDAFQATFLVLVHKAQSIRKRESLASWLYGVAQRIARHMQTEGRRWSAQKCEPRQPALADPGMDAAWHELCAVLDEELRGLSENYRTPLVLCYLEGQTRDQAARQLGWSLRTLHRRLDRGRELLRARLIRRGLTLAAGLLATAIAGRATSATVPVRLVEATLQAASLIAAAKTAAGALSPRAAALIQGVLRTMSWTKRIALTTVTVVFVGFAGSGAYFLAGAAPGQNRLAPRSELVPLADDADTLPGNQLSAPGAETTGSAAALRPARNRAATRANLHKLAIAVHNYLDTYGYFPPPAIYSGQSESHGGMTGMMEEGGAGGGTGDEAGPGAKGSGGGGRGPGDRLMAPTGGRGSGTGGGMGMGGSTAGGPAAHQAGPGAKASEGASVGAGGPPMMMGRGGGGGVVGVGMGGPGGVMAARAARPNLSDRALLSWRVAILPFLGEERLYKQFRLQEPWDSPHNKNLLVSMPGVFASARSNVQPGHTSYQVFVGPGAAFEKHRAFRLADIVDGTSNTIMIVDAGKSVPWTKPEDLPFDPDDPLPDLGDLVEHGMQAAFCDGSVRTIRPNVDEEQLRAAITRAGGEVLDDVRLFEVARARTDRTGAQQENRHLKLELQQRKATLDRLKADIDSAQDAEARDEETARLIEENKRLRQQIERLKQETAALMKLQKSGQGPREKLRKD